MSVKPIVRTAVLVLAAAKTMSVSVNGAELRTYSYSEVLTARSADSELPPLSGVIYQLPRTRVHFKIPLRIERESAFLITRTNEVHSLKTNNLELSITNEVFLTNAVVGSDAFVMCLDTNAPLQMTPIIEDDPDLAFLLVPEGSFLVDSTGGKITFATNSGMLAHVGVGYEDMKAEAIAGTLKVLGEVAGTAIGAMGVMSAKNDGPLQITNREPMNNVSWVYEDDVLVNDMIEQEPKLILQPRELKLDKAVTRLVELANIQLAAEGKKTIETNAVRMTSIKLEVSASQTFHKLSANKIVAGGGDHERLGGKKLGYVHGVVYRTPVQGEFRLLVGDDDKPYASIRQRIPEAGRTGWIELTSKLFSKVSPSIQFQADGGIQEFAFADTSKADAALKMVEEANTASKGIIDQLNKAATDKKAAEDKATVAKADMDLKKSDLAFQIQEKKVEINTLTDKLAAALPADKPGIETSLRKSEHDLEILNKRMDWLNKNVLVGGT